MRLIFEIGHMRNASPATVSRGGVIYLSDTDVGVMPFIQSWIDRRECEPERTQLMGHFQADKFKATIEYVKRNFKTIVKQDDITIIRTICFLLEGLLEQVIRTLVGIIRTLVGIIRTLVDIIRTLTGSRRGRRRR
jgi:dynein heavy chain